MISWNSIKDGRFFDLVIMQVALCESIMASKRKIQEDACVVCEEVVTDAQDALDCDICGHWQHRLCGSREYNLLHFFKYMDINNIQYIKDIE